MVIAQFPTLFQFLRSSDEDGNDEDNSNDNGGSKSDSDKSSLSLVVQSKGCNTDIIQNFLLMPKVAVTVKEH